jgi:hypothetical protein
MSKELVCVKRAKQNAKRLHGASPKWGYHEMNSPSRVEVSHTDPSKTKIIEDLPGKMAAAARSNKQRGARGNPTKKRSHKGGLAIEAYPVPVAMTYVAKPRHPVIDSSKDGVRINGTEMFDGDIAGTASFTWHSYPVNPGLDYLPWLHKQAAGWERYRFTKLEFRYVPSAAVTTTTGRVTMAVDYDPSDVPIETEVDLSTYAGVVSGPVYRPLTVRANPRLLNEAIKWNRVRSGPVSSDLVGFDPCRFIFAVAGAPSLAELGQLWIDYTVEFQIRATEPRSRVPPSFAGLSTTAVQTINSTATDISWALSTVVSGFGSVLVSGDPSTVHLPPGAYRITCNLTFEVRDTNPAEVFASMELHAVTGFEGASVIAPASQMSTGILADVTEKITLPCEWFVSTATASTFRVRSTMSGNAGTLDISRLVAGASSLMIQAI